MKIHQAVYTGGPTGFEPAERNWLDGWFLMSEMIVLCHLWDVKRLPTPKALRSTSSPHTCSADHGIDFFQGHFV